MSDFIDLVDLATGSDPGADSTATAQACTCDDQSAEPDPAGEGTEIGRRKFIAALGAASGTAFLASCDAQTRERIFGQQFRELAGDELAEVLKRLEDRYSKEFGKKVTVGAEPPMEGVVFGAALDLSRCVGCRSCVYACVEENNQSRDPELHYIKVLEIEKGRPVDPSEGNAYYDHELVPRDDHFYLPMACQMCEDPPCTKVCPVGATWREADGIVVVDYDWCIGCRYCMAACPYEARKFNWAKPVLPADELNPTTHYLGNRPRPMGVVEKCTFCIQRSRKGLYPACVEACPVGARKFGNLLDPQSEVRKVIENTRIFVLKEELNTQPKFFYYWSD